MSGIVEMGDITISAEPGAIRLDGIGSVGVARKWYRLINMAVNDGYMPTTKIVGIKPLTSNINMFHTARYIRDNFADISRNLMQLHIRGFKRGKNDSDDEYDDAYRDLIILKIRTDENNKKIADGNVYVEHIKNRGGLITTDDVAIYRMAKTGLAILCGAEFIEHDAPICQIVDTDDGSVLPNFKIGAAVLSACGTLSIMDIRKHLGVGKNTPTYHEYIYLDARFTANSLLRVLPMDEKDYNKSARQLRIRTHSIADYTAEDFVSDFKIAYESKKLHSRLVAELNGEEAENVGN